MPVWIKIAPPASQCRFPIPVVSAGGIIMREEYCLLGRNHWGPHRGYNGAVIVNHDDILRQLNGEMPKSQRQ